MTSGKGNAPPGKADWGNSQAPAYHGPLLSHFLGVAQSTFTTLYQAWSYETGKKPSNPPQRWILITFHNQKNICRIERYHHRLGKKNQLAAKPSIVRGTAPPNFKIPNMMVWRMYLPNMAILGIYVLFHAGIHLTFMILPKNNGAFGFTPSKHTK